MLTGLWGTNGTVEGKLHQMYLEHEINAPLGPEEMKYGHTENGYDQITGMKLNPISLCQAWCEKEDLCTHYFYQTLIPTDRKVTTQIAGQMVDRTMTKCVLYKE